MIGIFNFCPNFMGYFWPLNYCTSISNTLNFSPNTSFYHFQLTNALFLYWIIFQSFYIKKCLAIFEQKLEIWDILYRHAFSKQQKGKHCTMGWNHIWRWIRNLLNSHSKWLCKNHCEKGRVSKCYLWRNFTP